MILNYVGDFFDWGQGIGFGFGFLVVFDFGECGMFGMEGEFVWGGVYYMSYWVDLVEEFVVVYMMQVILVGDVDDYVMVCNFVYLVMVELNVEQR